MAWLDQISRLLEVVEINRDTVSMLRESPRYFIKEDVMASFEQDGATWESTVSECLISGGIIEEHIGAQSSKNGYSLHRCID